MYTKAEVEIIPKNMMKIELAEFKAQIAMETFFK